MTSIQQVNALVRVIDSMIDKYYQKRIDEIIDEINEIESEIANDIEDMKINFSVGLVKDFCFEPDDDFGCADAVLLFEHDKLDTVRNLYEKKETIELEWQKMKEKLQLYKDLLLVSKDSLVDKPEIPKELEKFLFMAVDTLYQED